MPQRRSWRRFSKKAWQWLWKCRERILIWIVYAGFVTMCLWLFFRILDRITAPPVLD